MALDFILSLLSKHRQKGERGEKEKKKKEKKAHTKGIKKKKKVQEGGGSHKGRKNTQFRGRDDSLPLDG